MANSTVLPLVKALFRKDEVAMLLAVSTKTVDRMLDRGLLEAHVVGLSDQPMRKQMRVTRESLVQFLTDPARRVV
jgi:hypothetical protein